MLLYEIKQTKIKKSSISGDGLFSNVDIRKGTTIGLAFTKKSDTGNDDKDLERTDIGKYTNHSNKPNCDIVYDSNKVYFKTNCDIPANTELTVDYDKFNWEGNRSFVK